MGDFHPLRSPSSIGLGSTTVLAGVLATDELRIEIPSIAAICRRAKLCSCSITTQHLINGTKFTSWNYLNCAQTRFKIIFFARINIINEDA